MVWVLPCMLAMQWVDGYSPKWAMPASHCFQSTNNHNLAFKFFYYMSSIHLLDMLFSTNLKFHILHECCFISPKLNVAFSYIKYLFFSLLVLSVLFPFKYPFVTNSPQILMNDNLLFFMFLRIGWEVPLILSVLTRVSALRGKVSSVGRSQVAALISGSQPCAFVVVLFCFLFVYVLPSSYRLN